MANTLKFGNENWATKKDSILAYNDENANFKPLPFVTSRESTATRVNKLGLIEKVASGIPRVDYLGNTKGAYLLEPQSTNLIAQSEAFGSSYWIKSGASIQGDASTAGVELLNDGSITNSGGGVMTFISGGVNAVSDGTSGSSLRPRILWSGLSAGIYKITITPTVNSGSSTFGLYNGTSYEFQNSTIEAKDLYVYNNGSSSLWMALDGTQTFDIDFQFSIKEVQGFVSPSADTPLGAFKLVEDTSTGIHYTPSLASTTNGSVTGSVYAKYISRFLRLTIHDASNSNEWYSVIYDLQNGTINNSLAKTVTVFDSKIELISDGYYRCSITADLGTSASTVLYIQSSDGTAISSGDNRGRGSYTGDGTSGVYIFGAQLEEGSYASSYIPTSGSQITRLADTASQTLPDGIIGQTEGTLFIDFKPQTLETTSRYLSIENSSSVGNGWMGVFAILMDGNIRFRFYGNGWDFNTDIFIERDTRYKIAFSYKNGVQTSAYINGNLMQNLTASLNGKSYQKIRLSEAPIGVRGDAHFKDLRVYNTALTDAELVTLTQV